MSHSPDNELSELVSAIQGGVESEITEQIETIGANEVARNLIRLPVDERVALVSGLPSKSAAHLLEILPDFESVEIVEHLAPEAAVGIIERLPSNARADVIASIDDRVANKILERMSDDDAGEARRLAEYPSDSAGGLMITEYLSYPQTLTCDQVIEDLRANAGKYKKYDVQYAFVTDEVGRLTGVLRLRELLMEKPGIVLTEMMIPNPKFVKASMPLDGLIQQFDEYSFFGFPVIDESEKIIGVIRRVDVEEEASEEASRTLLRFLGILGGEEWRTMPLTQRASRRLSWLTLNIGLNLIAASIIAVNQETLEAVIALSIFLPVISDMSGCSGNQAVAVSMRELSTGLLKPNEVLRVLWKEASIGVCNGICLGLLLGMIVWIWQGDAILGVVVAAALALNTLFAVCLGGCIPLLLKVCKQDPALASGPILTTLTDMCGFFLMLTFAGWALPFLKT